MGKIEQSVAATGRGSVKAYAFIPDRHQAALGPIPRGALALCLGAALLAGCSGGSGSGSAGPPLLGNGGGGGGGYGNQRVVGKLTMAAPAEESFILRGTLPLPPGVHFDEDLLVPFRVVDSDGTLAPTQVEAVTRYPDEEDGIDVVELIARVHRPFGVNAGERADYAVVHRAHAAENYRDNQEVRALLATPGALTLRTRDVYDNIYDADLFREVREDSSRAVYLREGELAKQIRTHQVLRPLGNPSNGLPHMMGAQAYITQWASEPFISVDLHVHNGLDGHDQHDPADDALDKIYFDSLDLRVPIGWHVLQAFENPYFGNPSDQGGWRTYPLVKSMANGKLHMMPRQSHFVRRLMVVKNGYQDRARMHLMERNLAFSQRGTAPNGSELWSWWNQDTARYYPQSHRLPSLDHVGLGSIAASLSADLAERTESVANGTGGSFPLTTPALGWAQPWGVPYGGMTGSDEIYNVDGIEVAATWSQDGYRFAQLVSRLYMDRQPTALYNIGGEPTKVEDWIVHDGTYGAFLPMYFSLTPPDSGSEPFGFTEAPTFQSDVVASMGLKPGYEDDLLNFKPIDHQHYIRYMRNMKTMLWLGNDAIAQNELWMGAELFRMGYQEFPNSDYNHIQGSGLLADQQYVAENPGSGITMGRGEAWGIDTSAAAYASGDEALRGRFYPWFEAIVDVVKDGQSTCTGCIQATGMSGTLSGLYRVRQNYEAGITENALRGVKESVFKGRSHARSDQIDQVLVNSAYGSISSTFWHVGDNAPKVYIAVGPMDNSLPLYCDNVPNGAWSSALDTGNYWSSMAYAYELTGDQEFLSRAEMMGNSGELFQFLEGAGLNNLDNQAPILALLQSLNGVQ